MSQQVLLVEDKAHTRHGHYPHLFAQYATGLATLGCDVTVLTAAGWIYEDDPDHPYGAGVRVVRFRARVRRFDQILQAIGAENHGRLRRASRHLTVPLRSLMLIAEIRRAAKRLGPEPLAVVILTPRLNPLLVMALAPFTAHWLSLRIAPPGVHQFSRPRRVAQSVGERAVRLLVAERERRGGRVSVAATHQAATDAWRVHAPWVDSALVPATPRVAMERADRDESRSELGLPADAPIGLFYGSIHPTKSTETVWGAYCSADAPGLLVAAGVGMQRELDAYLARHPSCDRSAIRVIDGFIDHDTTRRLYSAVDYSINSFTRAPTGDSGTVADAIAFGVAVCCSTGGVGEEWTRRYGIGVVFESEDPAALRQAARDVLEFVPDEQGRQAFLEEFSYERLGARLLYATLGTAPSTEVARHIAAVH